MKLDLALMLGKISELAMVRDSHTYTEMYKHTILIYINS